MSFLIPKRVLASMISHALESDPEECCGVLLGDDDGAEEARRLKNVHAQPIRRYEMPPMDLMRVESEAEARGRKIVAIYHSHTHTQAYPSQTDVNKRRPIVVDRAVLRSGFTSRKDRGQSCAHIASRRKRR